MTIELTNAEANTLRFYLRKALIDAEGMAAIGVGDRETVAEIKSVLKKISK